MNTPDMEWEKGWKFKLQEMVAEYQHGRLALSCDVLEFVESLLSSRDTYWKERVRKEVEGILDFIGHWKAPNDVCSQDVDKLYLAIKEITRDNKNGLFE